MTDDPRRLTGRVTELAAGLRVRRLLPAPARRSVGPFVFFDHFGPVTLPAGADSDVGPHPHIGLATVTYLFEGGFLHRDSLGTVQAIAPGAINWMTAGRGIVHSERTPEGERGRERRLHGLQLWVALPPAQEQMAPAFQHVPAAGIPLVTPSDGVTVRVLVGEAFGVASPVQPAAPTLYLDVQLDAGAVLALQALAALAPEVALYAPTDLLQVDGEALPAATMLVPGLQAGAALRVQAGAQGARFVVIGGAPLERPVRMWWNFVAGERERIAEAAALWQAGGFPAIPGESERVAAPTWRG
jgi:redox-sensitive bicupin YhaK (pirin superfamily)